MTVEVRTGNLQREGWLLEHDVVDLALSLLDRARAIDVIDVPVDADELLPLYFERERAWLVDPLPVEYIFPLVLTALGLSPV